MVKILYPRSDSISAKVVAPSDFESMFGFIKDYVITGFNTTTSTGLSVDVDTGELRLKGLVVENTSLVNVSGLTDNTTNYLYVILNRDGNSEAQSWDFTTNTSGTTPTDGIKISTIVTSSGSVSSISQNNQTDRIKYALIPTGTIQMYGGQYNNIPEGWLLCDGSAISRTTYKDLFDVTGTQFGVGNGSSTFNIPDFRDIFAKGAPNTTNPGGTSGDIVLSGSGGYDYLEVLFIIKT